MADEKTIIEGFKSALNEVFGGNSAPKSASGSAKSGSSASTASDGGAAEKLKGLALQAGRAAFTLEGIGNQKDAVTATMKSLATFVPGGSKLAAGYENIRKEGLTTGKTGAGTDYQAQFGKAQAAGFDKLTDLPNLIQQSNATLNGAAGTAKQTQDQLYQLAQGVRETGKAKELAKGGLEADELSKIAVISRMNSKEALDNADAMNKAKTNALLLADQIDKTSKVTGKSRDVIEQELTERMKDPEIRAKMNLMNEDQRAAFMRTQAALNAFGPTLNKLSKEIETIGGPYSDEATAAMAALGPAGRELQAAMKAQKNAVTETEKEEAGRRLQNAQSKVAERTQSPQFQKMAALGEIDPDFKIYSKLMSESQVAPAQAAQQRATGLAAPQAAQSQNMMAGRQQRGQDQKTGEYDPTQATGRVVNDTTNRVGISAAGAASKLADFDKAIFKTADSVKSATDKINKLLPGNTVAEAKKALPGGETKLSGTSAGKLQAPPDSKTTTTPNKQPKATDDRDIGTLGKTNQLREPKDIIVRLAKGETVFTGQQMDNLESRLSDIPTKASSGLKGGLTSLTSSLSQLKMPEFPSERSNRSMPVDTETKSSSEPESLPQNTSPNDSSSETLKDLHSVINQLNNTASSMLSHLASIDGSSKTTADMSGSKTGNRFA